MHVLSFLETYEVMSQRREGWFRRFLSRIRGQQPLSAEDAESVSNLAVDGAGNEGRKEEPIIRGNKWEVMDKFVRARFKGYQTLNDGLAKTGSGWKLIVDKEKPDIPSGGFADIEVAFSLKDVGKPLEQRHLCAVKIQYADDIEVVWNEVNILRGVVHEHVIGYRGCFTVRPTQQYYILLEYANAGSMDYEIARYRNPNAIPETGTRYYLLQVCAGLKYLHSKEIRHHDLHAGNVLLKYNRDGTKKCMLADFGVSMIFTSAWLMNTKRFQMDIDNVGQLARDMMSGLHHMSPEAEEFISSHNYGHKTVDELLTCSFWNSGPSVAPIPKSPTPLLKPQVVDSIGYLPQEHPTGAPATITRTRTRTASTPQAEEVTPKETPRKSSLIQRAQESIRKSFRSKHAPAVTTSIEEPVAGPSRASRHSRSPSPQAAVPAEHPDESRPSFGQLVRSNMSRMSQRIRKPFRKSPSSQPPDS
jgi:serine/threonine protein kinase